MDRRHFLQQSSSALTALAGGTLLGAASISTDAARGAEPIETKDDDVLPIVDTHVHLWDLSKFKLPWIKPDSPLAKSFVLADYLKSTAGLNVVKGVYMEVDVDESQQRAEASYVIDICRRGGSPLVAGVISGRPASKGFADYIRAYKDSPYIKGVRQILNAPESPKGFCVQPAFVLGARLLGELGMSCDLCMRSSELLDGVRLIDACRHTRFILDHCGNCDVQAKDRSQWQRDITTMSKRNNVVAKISGIVASAPQDWRPEQLAPIINHTLDVFGPDRVMFAGDWPVCTQKASFAQWVAALKTIVSNRSLEDQKKLFHDNAVKFYGLK